MMQRLVIFNPKFNPFTNSNQINFIIIQSNLDIDWNGSPINHTCYHRQPFPIDLNIKSIVECEKLSSNYMVKFQRNKTC